MRAAAAAAPAPAATAAAPVTAAASDVAAVFAAQDASVSPASVDLSELSSKFWYYVSHRNFKLKACRMARDRLESVRLQPRRVSIKDGVAHTRLLTLVGFLPTPRKHHHARKRVVFAFFQFPSVLLPAAKDTVDGAFNSIGINSSSSSSSSSSSCSSNTNEIKSDAETKLVEALNARVDANPWRSIVSSIFCVRRINLVRHTRISGASRLFM